MNIQPIGMNTPYPSPETSIEDNKLEEKYGLLVRTYLQILEMTRDFPQDQRSIDAINSSYTKLESFVKEHPEFELPEKVIYNKMPDVTPLLVPIVAPHKSRRCCVIQ